MTYNWDAHWLIQVKESIIAPYCQVTIGDFSDEMYNGPFSDANYNSKSWPMLKNIEFKFRDVYSHYFDTSVTWNLLDGNSPVKNLYRI